jgi:hypothetical protein
MTIGTDSFCRIQRCSPVILVSGQVSGDLNCRLRRCFANRGRLKGTNICRQPAYWQGQDWVRQGALFKADRVVASTALDNTVFATLIASIQSAVKAPVAVSHLTRLPF